MKTVIMAGGRGTRISELFSNIPKPLIPITNSTGIVKPVLEWEIESLVSQGFKDIILTVSHMHDQIELHFSDGSRLGAEIQYFVEETPLGNAGALFKLREQLTESFLLLNADAVFDVDFRRMVDWHQKHKALVTLFTHPNSHPYDSGLIVAEADGSVSSWLTKEDARPQWYKNRVNAGLHVIDPTVLDMQLPFAVNEIGNSQRVDLDRQILNPLCGTHQMFAYDSPEYVKDMGTPERYQQVCRDFKSGVVENKNLSHSQKAIFLDRDGTINRYVGFMRNIDQFELSDGAAEGIRNINESGYLAIVVTNQPVIARGEVTVDELELIHQKMETLLGTEGAYVDGLYYCPHHPSKGYAGEVPELKFNCECRKPKPGMLLKAAKDFNIALKDSWMIGDGKNDVLAGQAAGCRTVLIGESAGDCEPDVFANSLLDAVDKIIKEEQ